MSFDTARLRKVLSENTAVVASADCLCVCLSVCACIVLPVYLHLLPRVQALMTRGLSLFLTLPSLVTLLPSVAVL